MADHDKVPSAQISSQTGAVATPALAVPALPDSPEAALAFAARRFMARPEITDTIVCGSNGYAAHLPSSVEARLNLYAKWPGFTRCLRFAESLEKALAEPADVEHVTQAIVGLIAAFPAGDRAVPAYRETTISLLAEEAAVQGWSATAVTDGLLAVLRSSRFLPAPVEVLEAVRKANRELRHAARMARQSADVAYALQWGLYDEGAIEIEYDAGDF